MTNDLNIQIVKGGFVLGFNTEDADYSREVFVSQQKLIKRIKELIEQASFVPPDKE